MNQTRLERPARRSTCIPIVLFAYKRPDHTLRTLNAFSRNAEASDSVLHVYCDGPKVDATDQDFAAIAEVRRLLRQKKWCKSIEIHEASHNLGLAQSIVRGVTAMVEAYEKVIVLEDDLEVSPFFLRYMNQSMSLYEGVANVASIHGYNVPMSRRVPDTFFLRGADCWGWGVWRRSWLKFVPDPQVLLDTIESRGCADDFDFEGRYPFTAMLRDRALGKNDSWAILWYASAYLEGMLTLYPGRSLVTNFGHDGTGTHCTLSKAYETTHVATRPLDVSRIPIFEDAGMRDRYGKGLAKQHGSARTTGLSRANSGLRALTGKSRKL